VVVWLVMQAMLSITTTAAVSNTLT
jgi:hypothetical protein